MASPRSSRLDLVGLRLERGDGAPALQAYSWVEFAILGPECRATSMAGRAGRAGGSGGGGGP
jgi:hypothetical protein